MSKFSFVDLTPDSILDAVESIGIYAESGLLALNSYENRVYQFKAEDGYRYVVKFYRPERWTKEQIQFLIVLIMSSTSRYQNFKR